jgi:hypothetical protein
MGSEGRSNLTERKNNNNNMTEITKIESVVCDHCKKVISFGERVYMIEIEYGRSYKVGQVLDSDNSDHSSSSVTSELCDNCHEIFKKKNNITY